jgi:hypothetical protein
VATSTCRSLRCIRGRGRRDVLAVFGRRPPGVVVDFEPGHGIDRLIVSAPDAERLADEIRRAAGA